MNAVLLDTDVFAYLLKGIGENAARYRKHVQNKVVAVSFVTVGELYSGYFKQNVSQPRLDDLENRLHTEVTVIPYDIEICKAYGKLSLLKTVAGSDRVMGANDRWIAACAIRHELRLVTNNRRHFENIAALELITEATAAKAEKLSKPLPRAGD